jgi:hypothetical protein
MKQVKYFLSDKKTNEWIKKNPEKKIIGINFSAGSFAIIYEDISPIPQSRK